MNEDLLLVLERIATALEELVRLAERQDKRAKRGSAEEPLDDDDD